MNAWVERAVRRDGGTDGRTLVELGLLAAIWGASFLFMRQASLEFGPLPTAALRVTIAALALLPLMLARGLVTPERLRMRGIR